MSVAPDTAQTRIIRVGAADGVMIHVLAEHRPSAQGWRIAPLDGLVEPEALVLLDFADAERQRGAVELVRAQGFCGHVMILGDRGGRSSKEETISRPVRLGVLLARIDSHWLRAKDATPVTLGPYSFIPDAAVLSHPDDGDVRLTELECRLLAFLAGAAGELVAREQLLAGVWGYSAGVDTHTVETHIWRLRQKIETDDGATHFLVTEAGGYRLSMAPASG